MASHPSPALRDYWLPVLVGTALVAPIFISTVTHTELFLAICAAGFIGALLWRVATKQPVEIPRAGTYAGVALTVLLLGRGLFSTEPVITLYGAYGVDNSVLTVVTVVLGLAAGSAWRREVKDDSRRSTTALVAVLALYGTASAVAAWMWGSTDGMGGPASGFTPNAQYQIQLMFVAIAACGVWLATRRTDRLHVVTASLALIAVVWGTFDPRSSAAPVALLAALAYCGSLIWTRDRMRPETLAGLWTGAVALVGATVAALLMTDASGVWEARFDALGNGRGGLWSSAVEVISKSPVLGRGLSHATGITGWAYGGGALDVTTTLDPHNLFLSMGIGGGVTAVLLALVWVYVVQVGLIRASQAAEGSDRIVCVSLIGGCVAVFVFAQFAFVYPVAWVIAAVFAGSVLARDEPTFLMSIDRNIARAAAVATSAAVVLLLAGMTVSVPAKASSLLMTARPEFRSPVDLLAAQLALADDPWDVNAADAGLGLYTQGRRANPAAVAAARTEVDRVLITVEPNRDWDARLGVEVLQVWMLDAEQGVVDTAELRRIIDAGISADPASAMWATVGASLADRYGDRETATYYARLVTSKPDWLRQARASADAPTNALIEDLSD